MLILLDRDGTINTDLPKGVLSSDQLVLLPGAAAAIRKLNEAQIPVAIVTNQSAVGKGLITHVQLHGIESHFKTLLAAEGAHVDEIYSCTDHPDKPTDMRKPNAGMLLRAMQDFKSDPHETWMVGDALRDIEAGAKAGCHRALVMTGKGKATFAAGLPTALDPVTIAVDLWDAVCHIVPSN